MHRDGVELLWYTVCFHRDELICFAGFPVKRVIRVYVFFLGGHCDEMVRQGPG